MLKESRTKKETFQKKIFFLLSDSYLFLSLVVVVLDGCSDIKQFAVITVIHQTNNHKDNCDLSDVSQQSSDCRISEYHHIYIFPKLVGGVVVHHFLDNVFSQ